MNDSALLELFTELDSTAVGDALDQLDLPAGIGGIRPLWGASWIVGFAVTVALEPHDGRQAGAHIATTAIVRRGRECDRCRGLTGPAPSEMTLTATALRLQLLRQLSRPVNRRLDE
jgi:hypothetical protein